jgi:hypothetical protein
MDTFYGRRVHSVPVVLWPGRLTSKSFFTKQHFANLDYRVDNITLLGNRVPSHVSVRVIDNTKTTECDIHQIQLASQGRPR